MQVIQDQAKSILVPLADGFEEIECVSVVDILRRCGVNVLLAGISGARAYKGAHDIEILAPYDLASLDSSALESLSGIALPGGLKGTENLSASAEVTSILQDFAKASKLIAAICAAPIVLARAGVLQGYFTCYPGCESSCYESCQAQNLHYQQEGVLTHGSQITASGPASAPLFALEIARYLLGDDRAQAVTKELLLDDIPSFASSMYVIC